MRSYQPKHMDLDFAMIYKIVTHKPNIQTGGQLTGRIQKYSYTKQLFYFCH